MTDRQEDPRPFFTTAEVERAKRQVQLYHTIHKELTTPDKEDGWLTRLFKSEVGKWLISTILVGTILPYAWTKMDLFGVGRAAEQEKNSADKKLAQEKADAVRRDNSKFLADILPYLTSSEIEKRTRALDILRTRFKQDSIPPEIQRFMASFTASVAQEASYSKPGTSLSLATKQIIGNTVRALKALPKAQQDKSAQITISAISPASLARIAAPAQEIVTVPTPAVSTPISFDPEPVKKFDGLKLNQQLRLLTSDNKPTEVYLYPSIPRKRKIELEPTAILTTPFDLQILEKQLVDEKYPWLRVRILSDGTEIEGWFNWTNDGTYETKAHR